ncbi:PepSY domain-containing protein [Paracoccus denitrificans]|nr:PepSY domain-containing protein [Paracoccus denitrificans]UFS67087.1 PepSY domain-containing protein [Paracoccus denitrificans]
MRLVTLMLAIPALASPAVAHDRCTVPQDQRRPANELRAELTAKGGPSARSNWRKAATRFAERTRPACRSKSCSIRPAFRKSAGTIEPGGAPLLGALQVRDRF